MPITLEASLVVLLSGAVTITSLLRLTIFPLSKYMSPFLHSYIVQTCAGDKYLTSYFRGSIQSFLQDTEAPFHITEHLLNRITRRTYFSIESEIF